MKRRYKDLPRYDIEKQHERIPSDSFAWNHLFVLIALFVVIYFLIK